MDGYTGFQATDIRLGKIINVQDFPEARKPAYKLTIDLGPLGIKKSSAQIVVNYSKEELMNQLVLCLVNVSPRQVGPFMSEVLTLGLPDANNNTVLIQPKSDVPLGAKLY